MPINVEMIRQNRVVLQTYHEPVSMEDMNQLRDLMECVLLPGTTGKLHVIADFRQVHYLAEILLRSGLRMLNKAHPNTGLIVFITQDVFISTMAAIFMRFYPSCALRMVTTFEDALAIIDPLLSPRLVRTLNE